MGTLSAAISHLLGGDSAVRPQRRQRSGVFPGPATGARSGCSSGPESVFGLRRNGDRKSTRLNSSHGYISYAVFCLKKKKHKVRLAACVAALTGRREEGADEVCV